MSFEISIGVVVQRKDHEAVEWIGFKRLEKDGSDPNLNPRAGFPLRLCSEVGFLEWICDDPTAYEFYNRIKRNHPEVHRPEWITVTDDLIELAAQLRTTNIHPGHADRARWLQYWLRRAREHWGASAAIMFS